MTPRAAASSTTRSHSSVVSSPSPRTRLRGLEQYGQARAHRCVSSATSVYGALAGVAAPGEATAATSRTGPAGAGPPKVAPIGPSTAAADELRAAAPDGDLTAAPDATPSTRPRPRISVSSRRTSRSIRARSAGNRAPYRVASSRAMASTSRAPSHRSRMAAAVALRRSPLSGERSTGVPSRGSGRTRTPRDSRGFTAPTRRSRPAWPRGLCTFR